MTRILFGFLSITFLLGCQTKSDIKIDKYYDLAGVVEAQKSVLNNKKVKKTWQINSEKETKTVDSLDFDKELSMFLESDINKKAYLLSYDSVVSQSDTKYFLKGSEDLPTKSITVKRENNNTEIVIEKNIQNYLYTTNHLLSLKMKNDTLVNYKIETTQKLFWGDQEVTKIEGEPIYAKQ